MIEPLSIIVGLIALIVVIILLNGTAQIHNDFQKTMDDLYISMYLPKGLNNMYNNAMKPGELRQMSKCSWCMENERQWGHIYKYDSWYIVEIYTHYPISTNPVTTQHRTLEKAVQHVRDNINN